MYIAALNPDGVSYSVKNVRPVIESQDYDSGAITYKPIVIPDGWAELDEKLALKPVYDLAGVPSNEIPAAISDQDPLSGIKGARDFEELKTEFVKFYEGSF